MTYPQPQQQFPHQHGHPQAPGHAGWPPPKPPRRQHPALVVGAVVAFAAVVAVLITGFVAPGYFLADDRPGPQLPPPVSVPPAVPATPDGSAQLDELRSVADGFVQDVNAGDVAAANGVVCRDLQSMTEQVIRDAVARGANLRIDGDPDGGDLNRAAVIRVSGSDAKGTTLSGNLTLARPDGDEAQPWCVRGLHLDGDAATPESSEQPKTGTDGGGRDPNKQVAKFLQAVNDGDEATAAAAMCSEVDDTIIIRDAIERGVTVKLSGSLEIDATKTWARAELTGSSGDEGAVSASRDDQTGRWCVRTFLLF